MSNTRDCKVCVAKYAITIRTIVGDNGATTYINKCPKCGSFHSINEKGELEHFKIEEEL